MIIKRRLDYEKFCRMDVEWIQLWQVGKSMYRVENMFIKQWWIDLWSDWPKGKRLRVFWATLTRHMVKYYGIAPTVEELAADAANCDAIMADVKRMMKEQGFYEFFDKCLA